MHCSILKFNVNRCESYLPSKNYLTNQIPSKHTILLHVILLFNESAVRQECRLWINQYEIFLKISFCSRICIIIIGLRFFLFIFRIIFDTCLTHDRFIFFDLSSINIIFLYFMFCLNSRLKLFRFFFYFFLINKRLNWLICSFYLDFRFFNLQCLILHLSIVNSILIFLHLFGRLNWLFLRLRLINLWGLLILIRHFIFIHIQIFEFFLSFSLLHGLICLIFRLWKISLKYTDISLDVKEGHTRLILIIVNSNNFLWVFELPNALTPIFSEPPNFNKSFQKTVGNQNIVWNCEHRWNLLLMSNRVLYIHRPIAFLVFRDNT